jgi:hypothetical protein
LPLAALPENLTADLVEYENLVFTGWDMIGDDLQTAAATHNVLTLQQFQVVSEELQAIKPLAAVVNSAFCRNIEGKNVSGAAAGRHVLCEKPMATCFEDARILNVSETLHLNFAEAPYRGYHSAPELFAGVKSGDEIWKPIAEHFALLDDIHEPELVFAPQGLGSHCDHLQTIDAVLKSFAEEKMCWYFDTPYAIRQPAAKKYHRLSQFSELESQNITDYLDAKIEACAAYRSQIDFQFGGRQNLKKSLADFHLQSLKDSGSGKFVENFLVASLKGRVKIG